MGGRTRKRVTLAAGAAVYALLYSVGRQIDLAGTCTLKGTLLRLVPSFITAAAALYLIFEGFPGMREKPLPADDGKHFCIPAAAALLFASWLPMLLIEYPGSFMYDTQRQTFQIARNAYDTFHPLIHTLLIRFCLSFYGLFQSFEKCAVLYSLLQMAVLALCFSAALASLSRMSSRRAARIALLFFMLYPAHMAFASNCTKDVLFSGWLTLFGALCTEQAVCGLTGERKALLVLAGAMSCLFRNNMVYALAVWLVCLLVFGGKRLRRLTALCALSLAVAFAAGQGLKAAVNAGGGALEEMLSVPIQQLARARNLRPDCFDEADCALMDEVFAEQCWTKYEPTLADPVKNVLDTDALHRDLGALARLWLKVGTKAPGVYLDAFWNMALPSLYPYSSYRVAQPYIETGIQYGVLASPFGAAPMTQPSRFAGIREWLYDNIYSTGADGIPVLRLLFNTGLVFWLLGALWLRRIWRGEHGAAFTGFLFVLLWGTYLLGPVMQGRYLYPFLCQLPLFLARLKNKGEEAGR